MFKVRVIPCLDVKDGRVVKGVNFVNLRDAGDPVAAAVAYDAAGADELTFLDITASHENRGIMLEVVRRTAEACFMPLTVGGGIRDRTTIDAWLGKGVARVIIGTAAVRDPALVKDTARAYPDRIAVGLDARDGKVAVEGWSKTSLLSALDVARRFEDAGVAAIVYTDVNRDGMLEGLNLDATIALADEISIPVIASGGLASLADVQALTQPRAQKLEGAIVGRALYDGRLDAAEALKLIRTARAA